MLQPLGHEHSYGEKSNQFKFSLPHGPPVDSTCKHCSHRHHVSFKFSLPHGPTVDSTCKHCSYRHHVSFKFSLPHGPPVDSTCNHCSHRHHLSFAKLMFKNACDSADEGRSAG